MHEAYYQVYCTQAEPEPDLALNNGNVRCPASAGAVLCNSHHDWMNGSAHLYLAPKNVLNQTSPDLV